MNNVTTATFTGSGRKAEACPLFQYDYGQILKIEGLELPPLYEVDFGNDRSSGTSITVIGDADGVEIPNQLLQTGDYVFAWIVLHEGEDDRETEYMVEIPVIRRAEPSDEEPTPEQMTIIEQLTAEVADLKDDIENISGISDDVKAALLQIAQKVAYIDDDGADYYQDLYDALYPPAQTYTVTNTLTGCTTNNAAASVTENAPYSATITASSGYSLTGATVAITMGGTDITATAYNNGTISIASVTGNLIITVTAVAVTLSSIAAVYTQSGTVYDTDSLDSLKADLVVTATWSDSSTTTVDSADYTLSGTLTAGTSTITVTYGGKTTTFNVTVTEYWTVSWDASVGRLPSADDGISTINNGSNTVSFQSDGIHITGGTTNQDYVRYSPVDYASAPKITEEYVFEIVSMGNTSANLAVLASNGTDGCNVLFTNLSDIAYYKGTARTNLATFATNTEYKVRIEYESGVDAKVYLNNTLILTQEHANRSTYYTTANRIGIQNNASVVIKSMKWLARS